MNFVEVNQRITKWMTLNCATRLTVLRSLPEFSTGSDRTCCKRTHYVISHFKCTFKALLIYSVSFIQSIFVIIFRHVYNMGGKSSAPMERFFYTILSIALTFVHVFHQIVALLPQNATEIVRFLKTLKIWVFFSKKKIGFFSKKIEFFQNR